jgi:hypothetical protein
MRIYNDQSRSGSTGGERKNVDRPFDDRRGWWDRAGDEVLSWFGDDMQTVAAAMMTDHIAEKVRRIIAAPMNASRKRSTTHSPMSGTLTQLILKFRYSMEK